MLGKLPVPGRPTISNTVGQGPTALAVGAGGGCLDIFSHLSFSSLSPSLWEMARYRLKYCLKGPLNPKQPIKSIGLGDSCRWERLISSQQVIDLSSAYNINNQTQGAKVMGPYPYQRRPL